MSFTVADVLLDVREAVSDTRVSFYRYSDEFVVRRVNQILRRTAIIRPDLFSTHVSINCVAGVLQSAPVDSLRLVDVVANAANVALKEINQDTLDLMAPAWAAAATAAPTDWMRYPRDPNRFYVYPPPTVGAALSIVYAKSPVIVVLGGTIPLPDAYMPAIIDGTAWLLESVDAEHVESGRAAAFKGDFEAALNAGLSTRKITDSESGGTSREG